MNSSQEDLSNNVVDISLPNMDVRNITQLKDELTKRKPRTRYKKRELATKLKNDLVREEEEEREENSDEEGIDPADISPLRQISENVTG
ncbi:hypothetical protein KM043_007622 [Ampulex compressa]|nr:hypothetical protein KM043_007622 [Ampulex compressa]